MCLKPFKIYDSKNKYSDKFIAEVECGSCLACRTKKVSWLKTLGNWNWNKFGVASFVTLTYSNESLINLGRLVTLPDGTIRPTVCYKDGVKYLDRIKKEIIRKKINSKAFNKDFKYLMCTEYGEKYDRCHIHVIIFGIDHIEGRGLLKSNWKYGIVDVGELRPGGIQYVSEYLTKNYMDKLFDQQFEKMGLEKPRVKHSKNFENGFIEAKIKEIKENKSSYVEKNKKMPIPYYYKEKYNMDKFAKTFEDEIYLMKQQNWNRRGKSPSKESREAFVERRNQMKFKDMVEKKRSKGEGVVEFQSWYNQI